MIKIEKAKKYIDSMHELLLLYVFIAVVCAILYSFFEGKSLYDSIWWSLVSAMTVGYGDFYPVTLGGRLTASFLMHFAPLFLIPLITSKILSGMIEDKDRFTNLEQESILRDIKDIKKALIK